MHPGDSTNADELPRMRAALARIQSLACVPFAERARFPRPATAGERVSAPRRRTGDPGRTNAEHETRSCPP